MAVYTEVSDRDLTAFVAEYDIGEVKSCKGIAEGVENTNYLLATQAGTYILTLYEKRVEPKDLPFFLGLMEHLAAKGVPCPVPVKGRDGKALRRLAKRPAAVVTFLEGMWPRKVEAAHCAELGGALARLHVAGQDFRLRRANALGIGAWRGLLDKCLPHADEVRTGLARALQAELDHLEARWPRDLPQGVIHADLFPDNVFFHHGRVSGLIDFYFACWDAFAYDVAICLNAWCFERGNSFNVTKARRLLASYRKERAFSDAEIEALPLLARGSALRFLLTRLHDWVYTPKDALVTRKNPIEYWDKLRFHQGVKSAGEYGLK
ncbi:MAG: homoserine kinase [Rhodospirillales bacterium]|nr:homoserine kinase [Rhodospirillales bacterium]